MANIKPSSHGIVVDHKESGVRYAVSDKNYNPKVHNKVRDLRPGETVRGFQPKAKDSLGTQDAPTPTGGPVPEPAGDSATPGPSFVLDPNDTRTATERAAADDAPKTEGSSPEGTKGK